MGSATYPATCRARAAALTFLIVMTGVIATFTSSSPATASSNDVGVVVPMPETYAGDVQRYVNAHRRRYGLAPLALDWRLNVAAQRHAVDMAARRVMTHTGSDGSNGGTRITRAGYRWSAWGENVAAGFTSSSAVVWAWLQSSSHRANMLNSRFRHMGLGVKRASNGTLYWCLLMAAPR